MFWSYELFYHNLVKKKCGSNVRHASLHMAATWRHFVIMDVSYSLFSLLNPLGISLSIYFSMSTSAAMAVPAFSPRSKVDLKRAVDTCLYRKDGVRITHDPFAPGMIEKYGAPGKTDNEGFDPYADAVGPCLLYTSPSPRDLSTSRMPSSA